MKTPNLQPAYAEGFGVAGAHLSRRSPAKRGEGGTSNIQLESAELSVRRCFVIRDRTSATIREKLESDLINGKFSLAAVTQA